MTYLQFGLCLWILFLMAGVVRYRSRYGRPLLIAGSVGLFLWAWPPAAWLFAATLEPRSFADPAKITAAEAIAVLSGGVYRADASEPETLPAFNTYLRCHYAAWLYRHSRPAFVLVAGGAEGRGSQSTLARTMKQVLVEAGVPAEGIWLEEKSQSTYENAVYSARLLREKGVRRVVLVTEGYHMRRSAACFRKQGLEVVPAPVANETSRRREGFGMVMPSTAAIASNENVLHEWGGLAWYWIRGRI